MKVLHSHPELLPVKLNYGLFAKELAQAQYSIGLLQGSQKSLQNAEHLIGPLVATEAAVSSKIEGTLSTSSDIYIYDASGKAAHTDTPVVSNYRKAMLDAVGMLKHSDNPKITKNLIKGLHKTLLNNVRHTGKLGDFRNNTVYIAENKQDPIDRALYIPPEHTHIDSYIDNLLEYIQKDKNDLSLVRAGVAHYQFEAIHPFEDGNGRIGRLLIPLILYYAGELSLPIVYSSGYFEARPNEYRNALRTVDKTGKYEEWLRFFFSAICAQSQETMELIDNIQNTHTSLKMKYSDSKSPYMSRVIDFLYEKPVFTIPSLIEKLEFSRITATRILEQLESDDIIKEIPEIKGPGGTKIIAFPELLKIISKYN